MNQWINETVSQWISQSIVSQWISESANKLVSWWANESLAEPMDGWMSELLLCGATSSLSNLFAEAPLVWATSSRTLGPCSELPSSWLFCNFCQLLKCISRPAAASQHSIAQEWHYGQELPFAQLLQSVEQPPAATPLARSIAAQHHWKLCCAQPCHWVWSQPAANPQSRSVAPHRPTFAQRWQWGRFHATLNVPDFCVFFVKPSSRYSLVRFLPTSSSNSVPHVTIFQRFEVQIELSPQSCAHFVDNFPRSSRRPTETLATPGATLPLKTQGFPPESAVTCEVTRFRIAALPNYLVVDMMMWLTWWCER